MIDSPTPSFRTRVVSFFSAIVQQSSVAGLAGRFPGPARRAGLRHVLRVLASLIDAGTSNLEAVRKLKAERIEDYFDTIHDQVLTLSNAQIVTMAFEGLGSSRGDHVAGRPAGLTKRQSRGGRPPATRTVGTNADGVENVLRR